MQPPIEICKVIYATNIVESLNNTLRKSVRNRGHFPTEEALLKVLYLSINGVSKKWTMPIRDWGLALNRFSIMFSDRFPDNLKHKKRFLNYVILSSAYPQGPQAYTDKNRVLLAYGLVDKLHLPDFFITITKGAKSYFCFKKTRIKSQFDLGG